MASFTYGWSDAWEKELNSLINRLRIIRDSHQINESIGGDLDNIASYFNIIRLQGESDAAFRTRIKVHTSQFIGGGVDDSIISMLLSTYGLTTTIDDTATIGDAKFNIYINLIELGGISTGVPTENIESLIDIAKAAGTQYNLMFYVNISDNISVTDNAYGVLGAAGIAIWDISDWDGGDVWA